MCRGGLVGGTFFCIFFDLAKTLSWLQENNIFHGCSFVHMQNIYEKTEVPFLILERVFQGGVGNDDLRLRYLGSPIWARWLKS